MKKRKIIANFLLFSLFYKKEKKKSSIPLEILKSLCYNDKTDSIAKRKNNEK